MAKLMIFLVLIGLTACLAQSPAELNKLRDQLNKKYPDWVKSDWHMALYLKNKNGNVAEAKQAIDEMVAWRREKKMNGIVKEEINVNLVPGFNVDSIAKDGSVVYMWAPARWDIRKVLLGGHRDDITRYFLQMLESAHQKRLEQNKKMGNVTQMIHIMDLQNYNLRQHACVTCFPMYFEWLADLEKRYTGALSHWFFINTPRIYENLLQLLKNLMSPQTKAALRVHGPGKEQFADQLLKLIDADQLPKAWGGTKTGTGF